MMEGFWRQLMCSVGRHAKGPWIVTRSYTGVITVNQGPIPHKADNMVQVRSCKYCEWKEMRGNY